jgi:hypothetical protein
MMEVKHEMHSGIKVATCVDEIEMWCLSNFYLYYLMELSKKSSTFYKLLSKCMVGWIKKWQEQTFTKFEFEYSHFVMYFTLHHNMTMHGDITIINWKLNLFIL